MAAPVFFAFPRRCNAVAYTFRNRTPLEVFVTADCLSNLEKAANRLTYDSASYLNRPAFAGPPTRGRSAGTAGLPPKRLSGRTSGSDSGAASDAAPWMLGSRCYLSDRKNYLQCLSLTKLL